MVRAAERPPGHARRLSPEAERRPHADDFEPLAAAHGRQDRREAARGKAFARTRHTAEQDIVPACGGDFQGALDPGLPEDMLKVQPAGFLPRALRRRAGRKRRPAAQMVDHRPQAGRRVHGHAFRKGSFFGVCLRHKHRLFARVPRGKHHGERPRYRPQIPAERKLAEKGRVLRRGGSLARSREDGQQDGQVINCAFLFRIRRSQVDGQAAHRPFKPARLSRRAHTLRRFADRLARKPHDIEPRQAA